MVLGKTSPVLFAVSEQMYSLSAARVGKVSCLAMVHSAVYAAVTPIENHYYQIHLQATNDNPRLGFSCYAL